MPKEDVVYPYLYTHKTFKYAFTYIHHKLLYKKYAKFIFIYSNLCHVSTSLICLLDLNLLPPRTHIEFYVEMEESKSIHDSNNPDDDIYCFEGVWFLNLVNGDNVLLRKEWTMDVPIHFSNDVFVSTFLSEHQISHFIKPIQLG